MRDTCDTLNINICQYDNIWLLLLLKYCRENWKTVEPLTYTMAFVMKSLLVFRFVRAYLHAAAAGPVTPKVGRFPPTTTAARPGEGATAAAVSSAGTAAAASCAAACVRVSAPRECMYTFERLRAATAVI